MMLTKINIKDFKDCKKELDKLIKQIIFEYLKTGISAAPNSYMNALTLIATFSDKGDDMSQNLLDYYKQTIRCYILDCRKELSTGNNANLIDGFLFHTKHINFVIHWMNRIFSYLDRFYTYKTKKTLSQHAIILYREEFFDEFKSNIFIEVNKLIKEERNGNLESRIKIKSIMEILKYLDLEFPKITKVENKIICISEKEKDEKGETLIQDEWFNNYFKEDTKKFAEEKANADIHSMPAPEYVSSQLKYLDEESERKNEYINPKYHNAIDIINYECLIGGVMHELEEKGIKVKNMLEEKKYEQLTNIYKLFKLYPKSLTEITENLELYIKNRCKPLFENKEISTDPKNLIKELINLKREIDKLIVECFENNPDLIVVENKAFNSFMTEDFYAKELSNYTDFCMRTAFKDNNPEEIENTLNDIIGLFKCLNSKILFLNECNKKMNERLIKKLSSSILAEKIFISKLWKEAGIIYVTKMNEMMNDFKENKRVTESYELLPHKGAPNGIKLNVTAVSGGTWEISKEYMEKIIIPPFLNSCLDDFEKFYLGKYEEKKLIWCLGLSKIEITYLYLENKNTSVSTLPQLLSLLLLEQKEELTLGTIAQMLGCQLNTIITAIQGLVYNQSFNPNGQADKGVIIGSFNGETKEFKETDTISINKNFICDKKQFTTMPLPQKKSDSEIEAEEAEDAQTIKRYQDKIIQLTILRIVSHRYGKETTKEWLVEETAKKIDLFKAQPQEIKENIEKLIEKNFIKISEENERISIREFLS